MTSVTESRLPVSSTQNPAYETTLQHEVCICPLEEAHASYWCFTDFHGYTSHYAITSNFHIFQPQSRDYKLGTLRVDSSSKPILT